MAGGTVGGVVRKEVSVGLHCCRLFGRVTSRRRVGTAVAVEMIERIVMTLRILSSLMFC